MPAGATYEPIATTTLGSTTYNITFNSIPSTYTDLVLISCGNTLAGPTDNGIRFNNDASTTCYLTSVYGDGSSTASYTTSALYVPVNGLYFPADTGIRIVHIMDYSNTTTHKSVLARNNTEQSTSIQVAVWPVTSAITRIDVFAGGSDFTAGTMFTLYGIAAA